MSLRPCAICGNQISTKAERCPHCGRRPNDPSEATEAVPFLLSAAEARKRKVKCRECGNEVSLGAGSCPTCGFANPSGSHTRWALMVLVALIVGAIASLAAWRLGLLERAGLIEPRKRVGVSVASDSAAVETNFNWNSPRFRPDPPRTRSPKFAANCLTPAPVLVYEIDKTPSMFNLRLDMALEDPTRLTDSIVKRYQLRSGGYDKRRNGVFVWSVKPPVVSALRCESGVASIEEVSR